MDKLNEVTINGVTQSIREYHGQRVVTFKDIDRIHKRPEGTARKRFNDNKKHFIEGEDFFKAKCMEVRAFFGQTPPNGFNPDADINLITESGYLMLVKSLTDDLAWDVQRKLVKTYFRKNNEVINTTNDITTPLTREELATYMMYNSQIIDSIKADNKFFIKSIRDSNEALLTQQINSLNCMIDFVKEFCGYENKQTEKYGSMMASGLYSLNKAIENFVKISGYKNFVLPSPASVLQEEIDKTDEDEWKNSALKISESICENLNIKGRNIALLKIYASIKKNDGIDLRAEKEKYMKQHNIQKMSIISFISTSENLKNLFDQRAKELLETTFCSNRENKSDNKQVKAVPFSGLAMRVPLCIWDIVKPLYKIGYSKASVMKYVYREIEETSGLSLENVARAYAKQHQIKNVNRGFVISQDEKLMNLLKDSVNNIIDKKNTKV